MKNSTNFRIVFVTTENIDSAKNIAHELVKENLAACCSIINNVTSVFEWENTIQEENEFLLMIKTSKEKLNAMEQKILELHPYEVPEILTVDINEGTDKYLKWMNSVL